MAGYQGRKGPNVSNYLANLNAIPSAHDVAEENFDIDEQLAQFTNTEFLDFDTGNFLEQSVPEYSPDGKKNADESKGLDFVNGGFQFADIDSFLPQDTQTSLSSTLQTPYTSTPAHTTLPSPLYTQSASPVDFNPSPYPGQKHTLSSPPNGPSSFNNTGPTTPQDAAAQQENPASRLAAEEDKRRRNTAASARFRVKKKQREQALEQTAKELEGKTAALEQRIGQLETENEWLRGLVVEKHGGVKEDLRLRWKRDGGKEERSSGVTKKGVGTEGEEGA